MAFSVKDVVSDKLDEDYGYVWANWTIQTGVIDLETVMSEQDGWFKAGDCHEDGEDFSREMDANDKVGHGGTYGQMFAKQKDTVETAFIGTRSADLNKLVYGKDNVEVVPAASGKKGYIKINHRFTTPSELSIIFPYRADNGLHSLELFRRGQVDPNNSYTRQEGELTAIDITITALPVDDLDEGCYYRETLYELEEV